MIICTDISDQDNFFGDVYPKTLAKMRAAKDDAERKQIQADFDNLMYQGYIRNLKAIDDYETGIFDESNDGPRMMMEAAEETYRAFAFKNGLIKPQVKRRDLSGRFTPPDLMLKYFKALRKNPGIFDILKNAFLAAPFLWGIINLKQDFLFRVASMVTGQIVLLFSLLLRGSLSSIESIRLPLLDTTEVPAMRSALFLNFFSAGAAFTATSALTRLFMMRYPFQTRLVTSMCSVVVGSALAASLFEVFEPLDNKGWRFRQVLEEEHAQAQADSLAQALAANKPSGGVGEKTTQMYDFEYDPDEEDEEDLLEADVPEEVVEDHYKTEDEMYAQTADREYEQFVRERKQERRAIMGLDEEEGDEKLSDAARVGAKEGMFVDEKDVPGWLRKAFDANCQVAPWARVPRVLPRDPYFSEVAIPGPKFFRDKTPKWMEPFILEPDTDVKDQLAKMKRQYGAYRKAMHKKDKGVRLRPCDVDSYEELSKLGRKRVSRPGLKK